MKAFLNKCAALLAVMALLVCATGCAAQAAGQGGAETAKASPALPQPGAEATAEAASPQALSQAEQFASLENARLLAEKSDPWAALAYEGKPENAILVWPKGRMDDLILQPYQDGTTLTQAAESGGASAALEGVCVLWEGEAYSCLHATLEDAVVPGFTTASGGILWLEISGDCALDTGGAEYACISGFSSVYITGRGTLTLSSGEGGIDSGGGALPLPALVIDGPQVTGGFFDLIDNSAADAAVPTLFLSAGGLNARHLRLSQGGSLCVTGGTLKLDMLSDGGGAALVFRGGNAEIEQLNFLDDTALLTVVGGEVTLAQDTISTQSVVVAGGSLTAPQLGEKPGLALLSGEAITADAADGRPYDKGSPAEWMEASELAKVQARQQEVSICDAALVGWTVAASGSLAPLHAWGGLALELADAASIQGEADDSALGATALRLSGPGMLTLTGDGTGLGMWAWGDMPAPYFELRDGAALVIECSGESLSMGSESGGRGLALLSGGSLTADHDLWLQNSDMKIEGCAVRTEAVLAMEQGDLTISAGSLKADSLYLGGGSLTVTGGVVELGTGGLDVQGDIRITGGTVRLPGGLDALNARGTVEVQGGAVEDSSQPE